MTNHLQTRIIERIADIPADDWNRLNPEQNPFLQHAFLNALEQHQCLHQYGWHPQHIALYDDECLIGAMPMYLKDNSYGELVFDWSWADAYHRAGIPYYPKLVTAIPYTPATGPRLLTTSIDLHSMIAPKLVEAALQQIQKLNASSLHCLFTNERDTQLLNAQRFSLRLGCQFQWTNHNYTSFENYLLALQAEKRKKIKRERRRVAEQGIVLEVRHGDEMTDELWDVYHRFYCSTFERKSGMPTLSLEFFHALGQSMPRQIVIVFARHNERYVAAAFNIRGNDTLYGRHWGCDQEYHSLHFEACYYQGLEYCIQHRMQRFEPGAQGEHKLTRGFLPTPVWSAHWIAHPQFRQAIDEFTHREQRAIENYIGELNSHSPFRHDTEIEPNINK